MTLTAQRPHPSEGAVTPEPCQSEPGAANESLRVLIAASTLHIGGAEQVVANLGRYLNRASFDVTACYLKQNGIVGRQMLEHGVDLVPIPGLKPARDYFTSLKLLKLIRQRSIQLVHTHDMHGLIDGAVCRTLMPSLRHVHTFHFGNYPEREPRYARIEGMLWRRPDALVAVGNMQAAAIASFYGIPRDRIRVIWNGIAPEPAAVPEDIRQLVADASVPVIGSVSTLIKQKGLEYLIEAARLLKAEGHRFLLMIAGEGVLRPTLEAQAKQAGLEREIKFLGWVPEASKRALPVCDIFVQSSLWEAMSVVLLEAMAAGKPIVTTAVGENAHVVENGISGFVVPPRQPQALAETLGKLLKDESLRTSFSTAARSRFEQHFTVERMIGEHEKLYRELIGTRHSQSHSIESASNSPADA